MREVPRQTPTCAAQLAPPHRLRPPVTPGSHRGNRCQLRFQHRAIQCAGVLRRLPDVHGTRTIRTITREYNTKIADHEPAPRDARLRRASVHHRRARPGGDDGRKRHALGALRARLKFHGRGNFNFAHARPDFRARDAEQTCSEFDRFADQPNLVGILHHARAFDQRRRGAHSDLSRFQRTTASRSRAPALSDSGSMPSMTTLRTRIFSAAPPATPPPPTPAIWFQSRCARSRLLPLPGRCSGRR